MNDDQTPPALPPQITTRPRGGLGCFTKGCLLTIIVLMVIGIGIGTFGWFFYKSGQAFFTDQQVTTRVATPTDEQYQAVLAKLQPFGEAMNAGRAATVELTADDVNTLIARTPQLAPLRGQAFVEIVKGQLIADLSVPMTDPGPTQYFINARTIADASFAGGQLAFALRHAVPLQGELKDGLMPSMLHNPSFLQSYSQKLTDDLNVRLREMTRNDPMLADTLSKLRTVVLRDDVLVATSTERPDLPPPVATPAKTE